LMSARETTALPSPGHKFLGYSYLAGLGVSHQGRAKTSFLRSHIGRSRDLPLFPNCVSDPHTINMSPVAPSFSHSRARTSSTPPCGGTFMRRTRSWHRGVGWRGSKLGHTLRT